MGSADLYLKRAVLGLSVALVVLLTGVALYSLLGTEQQTVSQPLAVEDEPAVPDRPYPGQRFQIGDSEFPLSIGCLPDLAIDDVYLVVIQNQGATATDYIVSAHLTNDGGRSVEAVARADDLQPGEEREVVLRPEDAIADPTDCAISAVQGDRRVLLSGG
ncbi:MAG: hypothetical protein ACR2QK_17305 [Acidimicrobiales bacterium]